MAFAFRTPMISEGTVHEGHILNALKSNSVPLYNSHVAPAIRHTIRCIHGIDRLMRNTKMEELEVYLGRASTISRVVARWKEHRKERGHTWATVLFRASREHAKVLEKAAIRTVQRLRDRNSLCIGNANIIGGATGPNTDVEHEFIYMTWGYGDWPAVFEHKPSTNDIREIAQAVAGDMRGLVTEQQLRAGMIATKAPLTQYEKLRWYDSE